MTHHLLKIMLCPVIALAAGCFGYESTTELKRDIVQPEEKQSGTGADDQDDESKNSSKSKQEPSNGGDPDSATEPSFITVQHILIGFKGSVPGKDITRSKSQAKTLAEELLKRAQAGEDFDALVKEFTNDSHPGIYRMANNGSPADPNNPDESKRIYARKGMVAAFGDVGFPLEVGEIGLADYDPFTSKYGYHIIKRIK